MPNEPLSRLGEELGSAVPAVLPKLKRLMTKQAEVVAFSSIAIALYGYDQGMMSLINTNEDYLRTMGISSTSIMVSVIVSVYYLGCTAGAVAASWLADRKGRRPSILACLATTVLGNLIMFVSGLGRESDNGTGWWTGNAPIVLMLAGRTVMGLGVGGIDAVIPVYSAELSQSDARGSALAKEFQANILGLNMAFALNLVVTIKLGKQNQWAWRTPIIFMNVFPLLLLSVISRLPESPRWCLFQGHDEAAKKALKSIYGSQDAKDEYDELKSISQDESSDRPVEYFRDMFSPSGSQFHPTALAVMGQINQALTGYGAVSVYGPQILELLGFGVREAEYLTMANYVQYFCAMTLAWLLIDRLGRRALMLWGSAGLATSFLFMTLCGGLVGEGIVPSSRYLAAAVPGTVVLYIATAIFGIAWLVPPWLIPTEIYPSSARAQGAAISVIVWGLANFAITFITPPIFNSLKYWLYLIFAATNAVAGGWTYVYSPETGGRTFEENVAFFKQARRAGTWRVARVQEGEYCRMPTRHDKGVGGDGSGEHDESTPLLS